jgi:hypothetical protein
MGTYKDATNFRLSSKFPAVIRWPVTRTSDPTEDYNCFAYVVGCEEVPWWPLPIRPPYIYWPVPVKDDEEDTLAPVLAGFQAVGFAVCQDGNLEAGIEKIAIYVKDRDEPTHAAIQREDGTWQSKLGDGIDVAHELESLESTDEFGPSIYGNARYFMCRKRESGRDKA